jgi:EmrB/QacA subfamily drug resistance transporter
MSASSPTRRDSHVENPHHQHRWLILAVLGLAQLMVVLDATVVNIALPSAQKALGFSNDNRQWIITAYALAFGSLLLLGGRISDTYGRKWTFIGGLSGFAIASAVGGAAQSFDTLVAARAAQGVFGALLAPAALSLLSTTFTDGTERNQAFGIYSAIAGGGSAVGLLLGGVLTEYLSWRWCLYVNLALALPAAIAGTLLLVNQRDESRVRIDAPGAATVTAGLVALVYGVSHAETHSWGDTTTLGSLLVGAALLAAFAAIERRVSQPLLPLRVLADRDRSGSYVAIGLASMGMFGVFLFLTYYLQQTLGFSPIDTGLAFLPRSGGVVGLRPSAGRSSCRALVASCSSRWEWRSVRAAWCCSRGSASTPPTSATWLPDSFCSGWGSEWCSRRRSAAGPSAWPRRTPAWRRRPSTRSNRLVAQLGPRC